MPERQSPVALRVAVVGCGAVTRANLMPVLAGHDGLTVAALVDRDAARAQALASSYGVSRVVTDLNSVLDDVDAVVLATPPAHHAPATIDLAARGKHVFVEKPMAMTLPDAESMVAAADRAGVTLSVGLYRRVLPAVQLAKAMIARGEYGRVLSVDIEEGGPYGWGLATLDVLTKAAGGGGVLIDIGSHVIDVLLFILPGEATLTRYLENARGGIETDCEARFTVRHASGDVAVRVELSRTRELRGSIRVECEHATIELLRGNFTQLLLHPRSAEPSPFRVSAEWAGQGAFIGYQAFRAEIDDWVDAIAAKTEPVLSGRSVVPVVRLIDACYANPQPMPEPWTDEGLAPASRAIEVRAPRGRVLVTGAGGFLGGRAVELLAGSGAWDVTALVREPKSAAKLARWPYPIVLGDICSPADMDRAMKGIDAVVHCAVGTSWKPEETRRVTVDGTRTVAEAALRAGVKRFVHISTMFVHKRDGDGVLDESVALEPPANDAYGQNKLAAEKVLQELTAKGLSTVILRPTRIYGPLSRTFTTRPLEAIRDGIFALRGNPDVPANMVYVDNVVAAIARALEAGDNRKGGAYLISDPEQVTLREFFQYFADASGKQIRVVPAPPVRAGEARGLASRWVHGVRTIVLAPEVRALVHRILDTDPIGTLPKQLWERSPKLQARLLKLFKVDAAVTYRPSAAGASTDLLYYGDAALVSVGKAERELGFAPAVARDRAMALTLEWARAAKLVPVAAADLTSAQVL
ncbi:MAG: NAD-dependent epimerase/dehydratase family protein [Vicinamibacterales bacterium]